MNRGAQIALGALIGGLGVALGGFGAHALAERLTDARLATFETGARYQLIHALAIVGAALVGGDRARVAVLLFAAGVVLFSGSLYALALTGVRAFGAVAPIGGACFIAGWVFLALAGLASR
ncbi:MAG: DUF423 domain-containing protein [Actinomycetota bacterium]